jgi:tight adherence protein B
MRRLRAIATAAAGALALAAAAGAQSGPTLTPVSGAVFPDRAFVLGLPSGMYVGGEDVQVRENGELVDGVSVTPASSAEAGTFSVVVVVDASRSMRGDAIAGAMAAAKAFVDQRPAGQQVAIIAFNSTSRVVLPFTTDSAKIDAALTEAPPLANGTHIYDAVEDAVALLASAKAGAGSIVLLSDGADSGSTATEAAALAAAKAARVRLFTVGLRGRAFRPEPLRRLAEASQGGYSEATSAAELEPIFQALGEQLASEYLIRYRSDADPKRTIHVSVTVAGIDGVLGSVYTSPAGAPGGADPFHRTFAEKFWHSTGGMVAAALFSAAFFAAGIGIVLRRPPRTLRKRMAEFVSLALPGRDDAEASSASPDSVLARAEKPLEGAPWWARFKEELELADIKTPARHIVVGTALATVVAVWILAAVFGSFLFGVLGLGVPFIVRGVIKRKLARKRNLFADQLPDNLQVLSSALRAGHSLVGALSVVVEDCPEPSRSEFRRIISDEQLGVPLESAFTTVAHRMQSRDLEQVALVARLQRETGGNTAEVLDRVADTVRSRFELRRLVKTLTTQGRMSRWVVSLLPVGLLALITAINPTYMEPLYTHTLGRVLLLVAALMVVAGSLVIKRIIDIKV